ncbi:polygalacturonase [Medicago truncatula]|uniref:Polygalacturonase n=2 Tax=Medicago truncatula TaxID=3880 RepID=A0A072TWW0_MEDTR|nr:polygalacturonase [Medicago truncatula]
MQGFITFALIFCFILPCLSTRSNVGTKNAIYNVMKYGARGDGKIDDSLAFVRAWNSACKAAEMSTLVIPVGKTFMVSKLSFNGPCTNKHILIQLEGKIVAPSKVHWKAQSYWITVQSVEGLTINGHGRGVLDGDGSTWWQCKSCDRPGVFLFHSCKGLNVSNLSITNSPRSHVAVNMCNGATFSNISINSPGTSPNTDGFDIALSTHIVIHDSNIKSGDDCIAINGGSSFVNATRITCGPGHGISVGSLGKKGSEDKVSNIHVRNCTFNETQNGARIKTIPGGLGYAKHITFEQIILVNVNNPIIIDQEYSISHKGANVSVSSVKFQGFTGTSASGLAIQLNCSSSGCYDILLEQNNIVSAQPGKKASSFCTNAHGTARNTVPNVPCLLK